MMFSLAGVGQGSEINTPDPPPPVYVSSANTRELLELEMTITLY